MIYLVDTNILLGFSYPANPRYQIVQSITRELLADGNQLKTTSQNFAEFWNVSTRPTSCKTTGHHNVKNCLDYAKISLTTRAFSSTPVNR